MHALMKKYACSYVKIYMLLCKNKLGFCHYSLQTESRLGTKVPGVKK